MFVVYKNGIEKFQKKQLHWFHPPEILFQIFGRGEWCTSLILSNQKDFFYLYGKVISPGIVICLDSASRWREDRMREYLISTSLESFRKYFDRGVINKNFFQVYIMQKVIKFKQTIETQVVCFLLDISQRKIVDLLELKCSGCHSSAIPGTLKD